jgi:signal transduction histidine kinase
LFEQSCQRVALLARERQLLQQSYLEAVHETGARVTHDVKNLLQSLNILCSMASAEGGDSQRLLELMRRQLPALSQRLSSTLERLQRPEMETVPRVGLAEWWESQLRQYQGQDVEFRAERLDPLLRVPRALFDGVLGNLLQNALAKRAPGAPVRVRVTLECDGAARLRVCDSGRAVPAEIAHELLREPVSSASGLGIGLYQAARHAEASGYRLELTSNRDGEVCFALRPAA